VLSHSASGCRKADCNVKTTRVRRPLWRRIPSGLRYLRTYGIVATWHRILPRTGDYTSWVRSFGTLRPRDVRAIKNHVGRLPRRPLLSVILPDTLEPPLLRDAILSVTDQLYPDWELCIAATTKTAPALAKLEQLAGDRRIKLVPRHGQDDLAAAANTALTAATGEFILLLYPGDRLAPHALYMVAAAICRNGATDLVYSDEDAIDESGNRRRPRFKSDWNPDLLLGCDLVGRLAAYRRSLVIEAGGFRSGFDRAKEYDLTLRLTRWAQPDRIQHLPMVLYHRCGADGRTAAGDAEATLRAVTEHIATCGCEAVVGSASDGHIRVRYPLPEPLPGISLIIPTRDRMTLLRRCVDGLLWKTDYDNVELIVVDNNSEDAETHAYFAELSKRDCVRILSFSGQFNYSAINNFAVGHATHHIIGFINNDVEVLHGDWLREMVSHAIRPAIGAVGAKLLYSDDTIQHAGTIVGLGGLAGHAFRHFDRDDPGYLDRLRLVQNVSAVTAACLVVRKRVFEEAGGFDAVNLPVAYNDVDLCLRIQECGYRNLWTPFAELYHHESASRPSDFSAERIKDYRREMAYLKRRWPDVIRRDPFYNPNLTIDAEDFGLAFPPRVVRPWRR
jgi:O-antigen biosynthesis protein